MSDGWTEHVEDAFALAVDIAQQSDFTAVCVLHQQITRRTHWMGAVERKQTLDVRHLERFELGLSYISQVQRVAHILARPPLAGNCAFLVDSTGVGRAVADLFDDAGVKPTKVTITGGHEQSNPDRDREWHVPKGVLISALDARLHTGELRFAAELQDAPAMADELKNFRRNVSAAGRFTYAARSGRHDDLVLAVAIALWNFVSRPNPSAVCIETGFY